MIPDAGMARTTGTTGGTAGEPGRWGLRDLLGVLNLGGRAIRGGR
jgi:hypothetical protein